MIVELAYDGQAKLSKAPDLIPDKTNRLAWLLGWTQVRHTPLL
jgi:hypothetical protein